MKEKEYFRRLSETDKIRFLFRKNRGKILHFVVQYLALIDGRWRSIVRVDTCHGYAHKHTYHRNGKEYVVKLSGQLNTVFTESSQSVIKNYETMKANYLQ